MRPLVSGCGLVQARPTVGYKRPRPARSSHKKVAATGIAAYSSLCVVRSFNLLTALVADSAGSLACRLARCLALTAAALLHGLLQIPGRQCLNVLHMYSLLILFQINISSDPSTIPH